MRAPDVSPSSAQLDLGRREPDHESLILDPREGDAEDDVSSPKQKSLLAIAGSLLAEISLTKLLLAWIVSIVLPAAILGLAPLVATAWVGGVFSRVPGIVRIRRRACASCDRRRRLVRLASLVSCVRRLNFWALNALGVQPGYALCREAIRHLAERTFPARGGAGLARMRAKSCAAAGILLAVAATLVAIFVWPADALARLDR